MSRLTDIRVPDDIVHKARDGDDAARAQIYAALSPAVFGLVRRIVNQRALAEDLFQDTMMIVFERLGTFRGEAPLGAWVRQVAVTRCLMYLRSPWHRARLALDRPGEPAYGDDGSDRAPGTSAARDEMLRLSEDRKSVV